MSDPTVSLNRKMVDPNLSDLLTMFKKDILLSLNCHAIGTVQSFDSSKQTITATINYKKSYLKMGTDGVYRMVLVDYPILLDVPVLILKGGPAQITFPIAQGDECLIFFNDRDIDNWYQSGQVQEVASGRLHSFSDGLAFVGVNSAPNAIDSYDTTRAVLSYGTTMVGVGATLIKIANNSYTLNTLLQELVTDIKNLVTQVAAITVSGVTAGGAASGPPVNVAAINAITTQLTTTAGKIAGLLE